MSFSSSSRDPAASGDGPASAEAARYRALIQQGTSGVAEIDLDGRITLVNRKFCEITGYPESELLRLRLQDIAHPHNAAENLRPLESLAPQNPTIEYEQQLLRKDGLVAWVDLSITLLPGSADNKSCVLVIAVDVTRRHAAENVAHFPSENYRSVLNALEAGFCIIEMVFDANDRAIDYIFREINPAFEKASGLSSAIGRHMRELVPEHEQHWFDTYGRVARSGETIHFEQEARALKKWFRVLACRVGRPEDYRVAILFEDITTRKSSDQRRHFLSELATSLASLHGAEEIIRTTVDALGRFLDVERCYFVECLADENRIIISENYLKGSAESLQGEMSLYDFGGLEWWAHYSRGDFAVEDVEAHPLTREKKQIYIKIGVRAYVVQPLKQEGRWTIVLAVTDSKPRQWSEDDRKVIEDVVARVWPIVERARGERALQQAHDVLEERVAERTLALQETISELEAFSYSISHDLRAPLRAMQSYATIIESDCSAELGNDGRTYLGRIIAAAERMDQLICDVLVFSRVSRSQIPLERLDLEAFVRSVIDSYPALSSGAAEIELVPPLGPVSSNPAALTQCISNILENALKFVAPGVKPRIRIWAENKRDHVCLFIQDNGIGIPADAAEKIFGMFYQLDPSKEGTGIGLAVVRRAAERMGGAVGVKPTSSGGATFWLELRHAAEAEKP